MIPLRNALSSSVGRKVVSGLTGLGLVGFIITHLMANALLYKADGSAFNAYAASLASWGPLLTVAETALATLFLLHIVNAILLKKNHAQARPERYKVVRSKGGPTPSNVSSRNMALTGLFLLGFVLFHVKHFRLGAKIEDGYSTEVHGVVARDLHRLVVETFQQPGYVIFYVVAMTVLGLHLRHGFWSMFQTLGAMNPRFYRPVMALGVVVAVVLAGGFLFIPVWIYARGVL